MPRQYSNRPGSVSSPSPIQFGAAELNLGTPRFVAQTNVDPGVNVLAEIQQIIGMTAKVYTQALEFDTQEIKQKINYEAALQQKADRAVAEREREESRRLREEARIGSEESRRLSATALEREKIAASDMPEEEKKAALEALRRRQLEQGEQVTTAQGAAAAAAQAQATGVDIKYAQAAINQNKVDPNAARMADIRVSLGKLEAASDLDGAVAFRNGILDEIEAAGDDVKKLEVLGSGLAAANTLAQRLQDREERDIDNLERAAASKLADSMQFVITDVVNKLSDPAVLAAIASTPSGSIGTAAFDQVRDELIERAPEYAAFLVSSETSKYEIQAANTIIWRAADQIVQKAGTVRDQMAEEQRNDLFMAKTKTAVAEDGWEAAAVAVFFDTAVTDTLKSEALLAASAQYIDSGATPVDKLQRALEIKENQYTPSTVRTFASNTVNRLADEAVAKIGQRDTQFDDTKDVAVGWVRTYPDRDEFLDRVASSMGINRSEVETNPDSFGPLGRRYLQERKQYDADNTATVRQLTHLDNMAEATLRKKNVSADAVFDGTTLGRAIQDPEAIGKMTSSQIRFLIDTDTVGYAGGRAPKELVDAVVKNYADPRYARLTAEFWAAHTAAVNPALHNNMSREAQNAMMAGAIWGEISSMNTPNDVATSQYQGAVKLMTEMMGGGLGITGESEEARVAKKAVGKAMDTIFSGAGYDVAGTWFAIDDTEFSAVDLYANMDAVDKAQFVNTHLTAIAIATSVPGLDPTVVASRLMSQQGYQPYLDKDGKPSLVYNPTLQSDDGTLYTAMPYPSEMNSKKYKEYLFAKEREAQDVINAARVAAGEQPYTGRVVTVVEPLFNDIDAARGRFGARIRFTGGRSMTLSGDQIKIGGLDWLEYSKK